MILRLLNGWNRRTTLVRPSQLELIRTLKNSPALAVDPVLKMKPAPLTQKDK